MRAELVLNPSARRGAQLAAEVRSELRSMGVDIVAAGSSESIDAIVVGGGDGTLVPQIPRALERGVPVGLVPLGTFNDLARTLRIPLDVKAACEIIAAQRTRAIDVACVNGTYYVTEASIGISSRLARIQRSEDKQRFGWLAIAASLFRAFRYARAFHAEIAYNGRHARVRANQLTVANSQRIGGFITVGGAAIDDGLLECYSVELENFAELLSLLRAVALGRRVDARAVRVFRSTSFDVWTRTPHRISADGEPAGTTPACFELLGRALQVFAPSL